MSKKGWHLNALSGPTAVHIVCTRLTFTSNLKAEVKNLLEGNGMMVASYGE